MVTGARGSSGGASGAGLREGALAAGLRLSKLWVRMTVLVFELRNLRLFEVEVVVVAAARVEGGLAVGTAAIGVEVFVDGEFGFADSAQDGWSLPFVLGPDFGWMACQRGVAIDAGVVGAAASHLHGDDVFFGVVVTATGVGIEVEAVDFGDCGCLCAHGEDPAFILTGAPDFSNAGLREKKAASRKVKTLVRRVYAGWRLLEPQISPLPLRLRSRAGRINKIGVALRSK